MGSEQSVILVRTAGNTRQSLSVSPRPLTRDNTVHEPALFGPARMGCTTTLFFLLPFNFVLLPTFVFSLLSKNLKIKIYRTRILPVVLYGCETWSLTLMEEHRLRVFENRVLRGISVPKRDGVTGEWRKLHNEELNDCTAHPILCG